MTSRLAAAIVLTVSFGSAAAAEYGRLFFTPAQRAALDNLRELSLRRPAAATESKEPEQPQQQHMRVDGVLRRSDGKSTVWLNNRAISSDQKSSLNISLGKNDNRVKITVPQSSQSIELKVGQTVEIMSGAIEEGYARRTPPKPVAKEKVKPDGENSASGVPKVTPSPASRPVESTATTKDGTRTGDGNAPKGLRPDSGPAPK